MDVVLVLIAAWFIVRRLGFDFRTGCARVLAWTADSTADVADRFRERTPDAAAKTRSYAKATAERLRARPSPTEPRTAAGQDLLAGLGGVSAAGLAVLVMWLRLLGTDAWAAARAAQQRQQATGEPWWKTLRGWWRWPTNDEPGAPIKATAERADRNPDADAIAPPQPDTCDGTCTNSDIDFDAALAQGICDTCGGRRELISNFGGDHRHTPCPVCTHPTSGTPIGGTMPSPIASNSAQAIGAGDGPAAGEGGLGSYIQFAQLMAAGCEQGINLTETTIGDMVANDWGGDRVDPLRHAMEQLGAAKQAFTDAHDALQGSLNVADAYNANVGTGNKETVTNL